jgi:chemotaxis protein histidine kinase CheA
MQAGDRDRIGLSGLVAVLLHGALFLGLNQVDWQATRAAEPEEPVFVELEQISLAESPEPEEPEEPPEPEPEQPEPELPQEPEQTETPEQEQATEIPETQESEQASRPQERPDETPQQSPPQGSESQPQPRRGVGEPSDQPDPDQTYEFNPEDLQTDEDLSSEQNRSARRSAPSSERQSGRSAGLPVESETEPDVELPEWTQTVREAGISTEQMEDEEVKELAQKIERDPAFERRLRDVVQSLDEASRSSTEDPAADGNGGGGSGGSQADVPSDQPQEGPSNRPGSADIEWSGTGGARGNPGPLPDYDPSDFGGRVPGKTTFVAVFEVDDKGVVIPGSIIFQQKSPYSAVNEKLRRAISQWSFDAKPQAQRETAIFTLVIRRSDVSS